MERTKDTFYFYKITNTLNGKFYYGVHSMNSKYKDHYMGSGKYLKLTQKKYGMKYFTKEILKYFHNSDEMFEYEKNFVNKDFLIQNHDMCYNLVCGGKYGATGMLYIEKDGIYMRILPDFIQEFLDKGWNITSGTKGKICIKKDNIVKYVSKEDLDLYINDGWIKEGNSKGLIRIENDIDQKFVKKEDLDYYLNNGWYIGTSYKKKKQQSDAMGGRIHINNGLESKMIVKSELEDYLKSGWIQGRLIDEHIYAHKISEANKGKKRTQEAKEKYRQSKLGCRYINNGFQNKMVKEDVLKSYLKDGWILGMIKK